MFVSTRGRQKRIEALFPELQPLARARLSRAVHLSRAAASACAMYAAYALHGYGVAAALWIALAAIGAIVAGREILAASRYSAPGRTEIKAVVSALLLGGALIALKGVDLWEAAFPADRGDRPPLPGRPVFAAPGASGPLFSPPRFLRCFPIDSVDKMRDPRTA